MDENKQRTKAQARGCIQLGDLLIFAFGSFMMFGKTADILGKFAPSGWFGFSPTDYGFAAALLIEGFLVWRKVKMWLLPPDNFVEWGMDFITTIVPFVLSMTAQIIDGFITTKLIDNMPESQKVTITATVCALIGIPLLLDIGKTMVENAPAGIFDALKVDRDGGVGEFFGGIFSAITQKKSGQVSTPVTMNKTVSQPKVKVSNNGNNGNANP